MITPAQFQEKHARRLKASVEDIRTGVQNVTVAPGLQAAAKQDKMRAEINRSIDEGRWAAGLKRVTLDDWKSKMINLGINRIAAGIDAASAKVTAFASELLPYIETQQKAIKAMPDVTLEDSINRMVSFTRGMAKFTRKV